MKKRICIIGLIVLFLLSSLLTGCGGLHDTRQIGAVNLISGEKLLLNLTAHNYGDTGFFSNFTSPLSYNEMTEQMKTYKQIHTVRQFGGEYLQLQTDSGEFYLKYNGVSDNEFRYSLFAEVGRAAEFGAYIYIPFHMLDWFEKFDYPATATPFKGEIYFSKQFTLADVREYYEEKGLYTVKETEENRLDMECKDGYSFSVQIAEYDNYSLFILREEI